MPWRAAATGSNLFWMLLCTVFAVAAFLIDLETRLLGEAVGLLYVLAVFPSLMFTDRRWVMGPGIVSAGLVLIGWYLSPSGADARVIAANRLLSLAAVAAAAWTVTKCLRAQQEWRGRRESEERFGAVFENAAAGMALIQPDGRFQRVNPALCEMFGYSAEELLRHSVEEVTHPDDRELSRAAVRRLIDGETEVARFQKRYRAKDGSTVWTRAMVTALRGAPGQLQLVAVVADLSEQARVEQALRESEAVRRSIMECSPDYIAMLDREGTYRFLNRTARGYQLADLIGKSVYDLVSSETAETIRNTLERVAKTGRPDRFQFEHLLPEGSRVWFESHVGPVVKDGEVTAYILSTRDITSRRATERAFQESEDRYRSLVELSPDAILLNKNDRISYVNSAGLRLFGASSASQLIGKSAFDLIHADCHPELHKRIERLQNGDGKAPLIEEKIVRIDGTTVDVEVAGSLIANNGETIIQVVVRDISERKRAAEALVRSEQHFRSLIENSLDVFSVVNRDGTARYHSPSLRRVLGYGPEDLNGRDPFELVHADDAAAARMRFCEGLRAPGTHQPVEVRMRHRDGSWRWVEIIANNQLDNPAVDGITLTSRDVTERSAPSRKRSNSKPSSGRRRNWRPWACLPVASPMISTTC